MNEIANLCEIVGADINVVRHGVGTDSRIGPKYIFPGCGYGGTLFPQDINDLIKIGSEHNYNLEILQAVDRNVMRHAARKKVEEYFSETVIAMKYRELYRAVAG
jgi:UDPglucose 6-dehydrogenase